MDCIQNEADSKKAESMQKLLETNNNYETNKETNSSIGGDIDSTQSDGSKILESREERIKRLKEKSEIERQRKYTEIVESQRQSSELRQRQQEDRRKKIEELKQREEERKRKVEQRRQEMDAKEKEKNENFLKRTKEREERATILQKQIRMTAAMTQSMTSTNQNRLTTSIHSSGASSGSEKCTKIYNRSSSGCDVHRVSNYVPLAAGHKAASLNTSLAVKQRPKIPDGFIEVHGHIIPANTRHAGCFVPYKGSHHKVKGVLAWGPPPDRTNEKGSSVSWWAGIGEKRVGRPPSRATSAHASLIGCHGSSHLSTPQHLDKVSLMDDSVVDIDIDSMNEQPSVSDVKRKPSPRLSVKLMKTMSLRNIDSSMELSNRNIGKESSVTPRVRSSSRSRPVVAATVRTPRPHNPKSTAVDSSLYDRLSKPRSDSQPPKNRITDSVEAVPKTMSISVTKPSSRTATAKIPSPSVKQPVMTPTSNIIRKQSLKTKSIPMSTPDSGITPSPVSEMEPVQDSSTTVTKDVEDVSETTTTTTTEDGIVATKPRPRKTNKNLQNKEQEATVNNESTVEQDNTTGTIVTEEEMYRQKLAEQRRMKREAKEREQEEQRRLEEEAREKALAEKKRIEEETRLVIEEEARRARQLEIEKQEALEKQRQDEEMERIKKEEIERELDEKRREKLRSDDLDRMERKRRLEQIMIRVKKPDESNSSMNEENNTANEYVMEESVVNSGDQKNEEVVELALQEIEKGAEGDIEDERALPEPMTAWTIGEVPVNEPVQREDTPTDNSPGILSDSVINLPGPQTNSNCMSQSQTQDNTVIASTNEPQFKSRLLQSMMAKGRLATSSTDIRRNSLVNTGPDCLPSQTESMSTKRQSLILGHVNGDHDLPDAMPHSVSYNKMSASMIEYDQAIRNGLSKECDRDNGRHLSNGRQHQSDTDNEVTGSIVVSELGPVASIFTGDTDGQSGAASCSQLAASDSRPMPPVAGVSHALELS